MKNLVLYLTLICVFFLFPGCNSKDNANIEDEDRIFTLLKPEETGIQFTNKVTETDSFNQVTYNYIYNGSGVAAGDLNNDGLVDLVFTSNQNGSKVYLNKGNFKFEDITVSAGLKDKGWQTGVYSVDVNNDGWLDIYICKSGPSKISADRKNLLYINNKNNTFSEKSAEYGLDDDGNTTCATFFDQDNDGDLDVYIGNHSSHFFSNVVSKYSNSLEMTSQNQQKFYRNSGGKFMDESEKVGVKAMGYCLSATPGDFNRDGFMDLYVCNDYHVPDKYFLNNKSGGFIETHYSHFGHASVNSMGSDVADYNNDGWLDIISVDMLPEDHSRFMTLKGPEQYDFIQMSIKNGFGHQYMHNALQTNLGNGEFVDLGYLNGVARTDWSWAPLFADFDNDGNTDLYVTNGYYRDVTNLDFMLYQERKKIKEGKYPSRQELLNLLPSQRLQNFFFKNKGDLEFEDKTESWGASVPSLSTGAAYADLNNDGKLDLVVCNMDDPVAIYKNEVKQGNYLQVKLKGGKLNNSFGIGAKIWIETDSFSKLMEMQQVHGYESSTAPMIHIGLGNQKIKKLAVIWNNGKAEVKENVKANQILEFKEENALSEFEFPKHQNTLLKDLTSTSGITFKHEEKENPDFKREFLLPHRFTTLGPGAASADVNGDGLFDVFINNARESSGAILYFQNANGSFYKAPSQPWSSNNQTDMMGCLFFDGDGDGDPDLYQVSGGAEYGWPNNAYQHHYYENTGRGIFKENKEALKGIVNSGSCITAGDIDLDGDLDLFVGGRVTPGSYPVSEMRSYLLRNDKGKFIDITPQWAPSLQMPGLVCGAVFSDYNSDGKPDLIVVGEWMGIMFFKNSGKAFSNESEALGLSQLSGWFNGITPTDIDNDGDIDYIISNKGLNSFIKATKESPVNIYWNDFDKNQRLDFVISYTKGGQEFPVFQWDEMAKQFPGFMRKKFTTYASFANRTVVEVLEPANLVNKKTANTFSHLVIINNGNSFEVKELPREMQAGPMFGSVCIDIDGNGFEDIITIGNSFGERVTFGRDDAYHGMIALNFGSYFSVNNGVQSGFERLTDGKSIIAFPSQNGQLRLLTTSNNGYSKVYGVPLNQSFVPVKENIMSAMVKLSTGKLKKVDIARGSGYLGQNASGVWLNKGDQILELIAYGGKRIKLPI